MKYTKSIVMELDPFNFEERNGKLHHKIISTKVRIVPAWTVSAEILKRTGLTDNEIAQKLNEWGYKSVQGRPITTDKIRCFRSNQKRKGKNK